MSGGLWALFVSTLHPAGCVISVYGHVCVWVDGCECSSIVYLWDKLYVISTLISSSNHRGFCSLTGNCVWISIYYTDSDQREGRDQNQTDLYIYEGWIHLQAHITAALSTLNSNVLQRQNELIKQKSARDCGRSALCRESPEAELPAPLTFFGSQPS